MSREVAEKKPDGPVPETFGDRLRRLRRKKGISRSKLSIAARVPEQNIGRWEKGYPCTDLLGCARMAAVLGVSMDYLVHGETDVLASTADEDDGTDPSSEEETDEVELVEVASQ